MYSSSVKRLAAGLTALAASAAMLVAGVSLASADPTVSLPTGGTGSLTIHKYETPANNKDENDGGATTPSGDNVALAGVPFIIKQVNSLDLTTNAGWQATAKLANQYNQAAPKTNQAAEDFLTTTADPAYTLGTGATQSTGADGSTKFDKLPLGLYLVEEPVAPAGQAYCEAAPADGVAKVTQQAAPCPQGSKTVTPGAPFLVTVPVTANGSSTPGANGEVNNGGASSDPANWLYDVNVYPKNSVGAAEKDVTDDQSVQDGQATTWTVYGTVQQTSDGTPIDGYTIVDVLNSHLAPAPTDGNVVVSLTANHVALVPAVTFASPADYTATWESLTGAACTSEVDSTGQPTAGPDGAKCSKLTVQFTAAGAAKLNSYYGDDVTVAFQTTQDAGTDVPGRIPNTATVYPDGSDHAQTNPPLQTNTPDEKWGGVQVSKVSANDNKADKQDGAVFEVVTRLCATTDTTGYCAGKKAGTPDLDSAVSVKQSTEGKTGTEPTTKATVTQWTTHGGGKAVVDGLRYSCYTDGKAITDCPADADSSTTGNPTGFIQYWLVEVKAPAGYSLQAEPLHFQVSHGADGQALDTVAVSDPEVNGGFQLPFTGGTGTIAFYVVGALIVAGGVAVVLVRSRRRAPVRL